jgi:hypothetical protein
MGAVSANAAFILLHKPFHGQVLVDAVHQAIGT